MRDIILGFSKNWLLNDQTEQIKIETIIAPLTEDNRTLYNQASVKDVNFTDIPLLKLRSHFQQGLFGNFPILHKNTVKEFLSIDPAHLDILPLGEIKSAEHWFEKTENPAFQKLRHMNVMIFHNRTNGVTYLIPCTVLANYYLGHSMLLKAAMKMITLDELCLGISNIGNDEIQIHLPANVPAKLAPHIARFKLDPVAQKSFSNIHANSLRKPGRDVQSFHMKAPVAGDRTWLVHRVEPENSTLAWVTQLISCDSKFPFKSLQIFQEKKKYVGKGKKKSTKRKLAANHDKLDLIEIGQKSDSYYEAVEINDPNLKNEYPGLKIVDLHQITREIRVDRQTRYITKIEDMTQILAGSTGVNGTGDKPPLVPINISNFEELDEEQDLEENEEDEETLEEPDPRLEEFIAMIDILEKQYVVNDIQFSKTIPAFPPIDQNILPYERIGELMDIPWCRRSSLAFVEMQRLKIEWHLNARRFIVKLALIENNYVYIVEFIYFSLIDNGCVLIIVAKNTLPEEIVLEHIINYARDRSGWTERSKLINRANAGEADTNTYRLFKLAHSKYTEDANKFSEKIVKKSNESSHNQPI